MDSAITKYISILLYALLGISVLLGIYFYLDKETVTPIIIIWTYILFGIGAVSTIVFSLMGLFISKKAAKRSLVSIGVIAVIVLLGYLFASGEVLQFPGHEKFFYEEDSMDPNAFSRIVGTGLYTMYIFGIVAILSMIYSEVSKLFK